MIGKPGIKRSTLWSWVQRPTETCRESWLGDSASLSDRWQEGNRQGWKKEQFICNLWVRGVSGTSKPRKDSGRQMNISTAFQQYLNTSRWRKFRTEYLVFCFCTHQALQPGQCFAPCPTYLLNFYSSFRYQLQLSSLRHRPWILRQTSCPFHGQIHIYNTISVEAPRKTPGVRHSHNVSE